MGLNLAGKYQRIVITGRLHPEQGRSYISTIPYNAERAEAGTCEELPSSRGHRPWLFAEVEVTAALLRGPAQLLDWVRVVETLRPAILGAVVRLP